MGKYKRDYQGLTAQATYRFGSRTDIGGTYTLSHAWGNFDGENVASGPLAGGAYAVSGVHPAKRGTTRKAIWSIDQRHRTRLWINYGVPRARRPDAEPAAGARERYPVRRGRPADSGRKRERGQRRSVRRQPGVRPRAGRVGDRRTSTRRATRSVPKARSERTSPPTTTTTLARRRQVEPVRLGPGHQPVQPVPAVRVRLDERVRQPGAPGTGAGLQSIDRTVRTPVNSTARRAVRPVYPDPGRGRELGEGPELRPRAEPVRVHDAAHVPASPSACASRQRRRNPDWSAAGGAQQPRPFFLHVRCILNA